VARPGSGFTEPEARAAACSAAAAAMARRRRASGRSGGGGRARALRQAVLRSRSATLSSPREAGGLLSPVQHYSAHYDSPGQPRRPPARSFLHRNGKAEKKKRFPMNPMWREATFASFAGIVLSESSEVSRTSSRDHDSNAIILNLRFMHDKIMNTPDHKLSDQVKNDLGRVIDQAIDFETDLHKLQTENEKETKYMITFDLIKKVTGALQDLTHAGNQILLIPCGFFTRENFQLKSSRLFFIIEYDREHQEFCLWLCNSGNGCEYHPSKVEPDGVTRYRTQIKIPNISLESILDDAAWWMWAHLQTADSCLHGPQTIYEVLIPHLCGGTLESLLSRDKDAEGINACPFESIGVTTPELQACQGCVLLLCQRLRFEQGSDIILQIEIDFLKSLKKAVVEGIEQKLIILPPDLAMIKEACRKVSKRLEKVPNVEVYDLLMSILSNSEQLSIADEAHKISLSENAVKQIRRHVDFQPFPWFDLFASNFDKLPTFGKELPRIDPVGVSILSASEQAVKSSFKSALCFLEEVENQCTLLRTNAAGLPDMMWHAKVITIVQKAFTQTLPIPEPNQKSNWAGDAVDITVQAFEQRQCLKFVYLIARHYCHAVRSVDYEFAAVGKYKQNEPPPDCVHDNPESAGWSVHIVVMAAIMSIFDFVLRMDIERQNGQEFLVGDILCGRQGQPTQLGLCLKGFDGIRDLRYVFERSEIHEPQLLDTMMHVLKYFEESQHSNGPKLFDWALSEDQDSTNNRELCLSPKNDDCTLMQFFKPLLTSTVPRYMSGPAPKPKHAENISTSNDKQQVTLSEYEVLVTWGCADWNSHPEVAMIRELTLLFKILMEPKFCMPIEFNTQEIKWYYSRKSSSDISLFLYGKTTDQVVKIPPFGTNRRHVVGFQSAVKMLLDDVKFKALPPQQRKIDLPKDLDYLLSKLEASDVLYASYLPTFDSSLSLTESEKFLSYFSVPQIAIPLILIFFEERVGLFLNQQLSRLFEMVLFEHSAMSFDDMNEQKWVIDEIPVSEQDRRTKLATPLGTLMFEMHNDPKLILTSTCKICENCSKLCVGDSTSGYVGLLCFVLRNATRIESYYLQSQKLCPGKHHDLPHEQHLSLRSWLKDQARKQIRLWLSEAEDAQNLQLQIFLHAHLFLIEMNSNFVFDESKTSVKDRDAVSDSISSFLCSALFVFTWCSNGVFGKDPENLNETFIQYIHFNYSMRKDQILQTMKYLFLSDRYQFEMIMDRIDSIALRKEKLGVGFEIKPTINQNSWIDSKDFVVHCQQTRESKHPFSAPVDIYDSFYFPGASCIEVSFDPQTSLGPTDYISFFKDDSLVQHWGTKRQYMGRDQSLWIRSSGKATLTIPSNKFW
jgi:hypothetical protein